MLQSNDPDAARSAQRKGRGDRVVLYLNEVGNTGKPFAHHTSIL